MRRQPDPAAIDSWYALGYVFGRRVVPYLLLAAFWTLSWLLIASCAAEAAQEASIPRAVDDGRIPDFPVTRSHPPASWPSAANSSICRTYRKTAGEESRRRSPVANRWMRP